MEPLRLDLVGDVHGQLEALLALLSDLGYRPGDGFRHPDGRLLVFLGDLVDRGPDSLGVVQLALELEDRGRALCLMGIHEYNLVAWSMGLERPKASNRATLADVEARRAQWNPALERLRRLPLALQTDGLRVVHALWHLPAVEKLSAHLRPPPGPAPLTPLDRLRSAVHLGSPFSDTGFARGVDDEDFGDQEESAQGILLKGIEGPTPAPFKDADGKLRYRERVCWWQSPRPEVPQDLTVFGHYWHVPPGPGTHGLFAPPHPSGTPQLARWQEEFAHRVAPEGRLAVPSDQRFVCVDFNGVLDGGGGSCLGAFRWPEREIAWVRSAGTMHGRRLRD